MDQSATQINGALLALTVSLGLMGIGVAAVMIAKNAFKAMASGGNPRETGAVWSGLTYVGIGGVLLVLATVLAGGLFAIIKAGGNV
jgi:hypothetical protein